MGVPERGSRDGPESDGALLVAGIGVGLAIAGMVGSAVATVLVVVVAVLVVGDPTGLRWFVVATITAAELGYLAVGYGYVRFHDRTVTLAGLSRGGARDALGGTVGALVAGLGLLSLLSVVGLQPRAFFVEHDVDPATFLGIAAVFVLVAPPAEECLFRGAVQDRLRDAFGPSAAIAGAGLLFGSIHVFNFPGSPLPAMIAGGLVLGFVGCIFGYVYERTGNLLVPIAAHAGYNAVLVAASATAFV